MVPLTALHFHEAHPVGLAANFFLIPAASLAIPLTFLVAALGATLSFAGEGAAWLLAQFMILTARAAAPGYTPRLPSAEWRRVRARQRAIGVYRPERGGMVRITMAAGPARMERLRAAAPWPGERRGGWVAFRRTAAPVQNAERDTP